jgi:hypothetical protein
MVELYDFVSLIYFNGNKTISKIDLKTVNQMSKKCVFSVLFINTGVTYVYCTDS